MTAKVFVDGHAGTTGLKIHERLAGRSDIELLVIPEARRKDPQARRAMLNAADFAILCLPDDAAREAVSLVSQGNRTTRILDASTAHRTDSAWVYGLPELGSDQRRRIASATLVAVPGCHASGFIALVAPLVARGLVDPNTALACTSLTGYTGGGKAMIAAYEAPGSPEAAAGARPYALSLWHKHLPEMQAHAGLSVAPTFVPVVCNFPCGMLVCVPLLAGSRRSSLHARDVWAALRDHYAGQRFIQVMPYEENPTVDGGSLDPTALRDTNDMQLFVFGGGDHIVVCARFDNLGKGASGAAVQNLNLMLGTAEDAGL